MSTICRFTAVPPLRIPGGSASPVARRRPGGQGRLLQPLDARVVLLLHCNIRDDSAS
jgi:hypothetical protein